MSRNRRWMFWRSCIFCLLLVVGLDAAPRELPRNVVARLSNLPLEAPRPRSQQDYLIDRTPFLARAARGDDDRELILENGLIRRVWRLTPNGACVAFDNLMTGQAMVRSVRPEARLTIDGERIEVGGLIGQPNHAYLSPAWLDAMRSNEKAWQLIDFEIGRPTERLAWGRVRHAAPDVAWPPRGVSLRMEYAKLTSKGDTDKSSPRVNVHYELYDGIPVMSKWITVQNRGDQSITVERFTSEELALVEHANPIETRPGVPLARPRYLHVETDFAFGGFGPAPANRHVVQWRTDPDYKTQVNYLRQSPCLLVCEPTYGPAQKIAPGEHFEGFRVFELVHDLGDRERRSLAYRRMYRTIAPWVTENPITHHLLTNSPKLAREAIDKASDVGFEAIIFSFGSGFNMENRNANFLAEWRRVAEYARTRKIELGSYSLLSSRRVGREHMLVPPDGQPPTHGQMPSLTSEWGQSWINTIREFYDSTNFSQFENDGPYPGDIDVTPRPPLQQGINDSRWAQWRENNKLYHALRADGIYINQPDYHLLNGGNKTSMGYREVNWSLPRAQQVIHTRQNIYDGTWLKTPSMGWMHVPLAEYHGGGAAATIEPLHEHIDHYRRMLLSNLGMGVQAHYRGPRIHDTNETQQMVKAAVAWFKEYRDILESDIIHGRRADGRDLDWVLHANPRLQDKGMLCVYNPLPQKVTKTLRVNLYYTGLRDAAEIRSASSEPVIHALGRNYSIDIEVTVPPNDMAWYVIRAAPSKLIRLSDKTAVASRRPIIIAHRGGVVSPRSPECSRTAIRLAADMGYDMVELDIQRSRDGVPMVFHDRTLREACGRNGAVADFTARQLELIPYADTDDHIIRFETACQLCKELGLGVMLDLKDGRDSEPFLKSINQLVAESTLSDSTISISGTDAARRCLTHVRFPPTDGEMQQLRAGESLDLGQRFWFGIPKWLLPGDLEKLKAAGALVIPAINTFRYPAANHFPLAEDDINRLTEQGVDGFQIDSIYYPLIQ